MPKNEMDWRRQAYLASRAMVISTASISAAAIFGVGAVLFWSNPRRVLNRLFLGMSVHTSLWLVCVHLAVTQNEDPFWIRGASIISAFCPAHLWLIKVMFSSRGARPPRSALRPLFYWILTGVALTALTCTNWYVRSSGPGQPTEFGPGGLAYIVLAIGCYGVAVRDIAREIRRLDGVRRLELQVLLLGLSVAALVILALMAVRVITRAIWPIHLQPLALLFVYIATIVAVTTSRVFDARQIVMFSLEKLATVIAGIGTLLFFDWACRVIAMPHRLSLVITAVCALTVAVLVDRALQKRFRFFPQASDARRAVFDAAHREVRWDKLRAAFETILRGWGQSERTLVICGPRPVLVSAKPQLRDGAVLAAIAELQWVTPERLARERTTNERQSVSRFMREEELAGLVYVEGAAQLALVGVGVSSTRMPFTYPQMMQLLELATIMEGAFERVQLAAKVQHSEQLAMVGMVGASLAHEIRNPLVAIRTFVQMLPRQHHIPEFRDKFFHVVDEEVQRIEQLARQFLELSAPRQFRPTSVKLHGVIASGLELVLPKAAQKEVRLRSDLRADPDTAHTDAAAAKQVLLNLCLNALQALDSLSAQRREIVVATRNVGSRIELSVSDTGPGVAPDVFGRLFEPFQTTKAAGFGLGLAVCSDILAKLDATIAVDPPVPGEGATFRVTFPTDAGRA